MSDLGEGRWRMPRRRIGLSVAAAVAVLVGGAVSYFAYTAHTTWRDLRAAADLRLPPGYSVLEREERGTAFCFVSCTGGGEAQIDLTVAGPQGADPCADLAPVLAESTANLTTHPPLGLLGCLYGKLPEINGRARLTVHPEAVAGASGCASDRVPCARIVLSSGIE